MAVMDLEKDMPSNIQTIEIIWTVAALLTLFVSIWNMYDAIRDRQAISDDPENAVIRSWANGGIWAEVIRMAQVGLLMIIGVGAMTQPPSAPPTKPPTTTAIILTFALLGACALISAGAIHDLWRRRRLRSFSS